MKQLTQKEKNDNGEKSEMSLGQRSGHVGVGLELYGSYYNVLILVIVCSSHKKRKAG